MAMIQTGSIQLDSDKPSATTPGDTSAFTQVNFPTPFPSGTNVVVVPMTQTFNGPQTPAIRIADVTPTGFKIKMNEVVVDKSGAHNALSDGIHAEETIGWIAFSV
jgi:hypothetical protein